MKNLYIHIIFWVLIARSSYAQTTFVPDTNLRKVLKTSYASYLDANDYVVDAKAATFNSYINCSGQNIKDLTGLWKFTGLTSLVCQNNVITHLDSLRKFPNLASLFCFHNNISKLPDLSSLSKLSYLSCGYNQISFMPDLSKNVPLTYLDCGSNLISDLKGIDKLVNLQTLYIYNNQLDTIPDLSNLSKLQMLMCQYNNLKAIPGLSKLTQLTQFTAGNNPLDSLPDFSALTKMNILKLYNCQLNNMPNVSTMKSLTQLILNDNKISTVSSLLGNPSLSTLELNNNNISKFPDLSACKTALNILRISSNQLDSLPDFSSFSTLDTLQVQNNRLTFEDVIPLAQNTSIVNIQYAPQAIVGMQQNVVITEKQPFAIILGIDKNLVGNLYTWYKNGQWYGTTSTDTLLITQVQWADTGTYTCQISNPLAPLLILSSRGITLKVKPCIDLSKMSYTTTDFDCNMGGTISLNESNITGGQKPYSYKLVGNEQGSVRYPNGNLFTNLFENSYTLEVKDKAGCKVPYTTNITLKGKRGTDCKQLIIIGDESSPNNTLFVEEKGTAKVYDSEGQLVQTFATPTVWDGKNQNGAFLPGYYVVELNGKTFNVTLIK